MEHEAALSQGGINAAKAIETLYAVYNNAQKNCVTVASCILGHVVCSPPIRLGAGTADEQYTEDYAIIEVDDNKIDRTNFKGNVVDLGTKIPIWEFTKEMYPNPRNATSFKYPANRLLKLQGTISDEEMRHPTMLDQNGESCLMVIKNGSTTGVTISRANALCPSSESTLTIVASKPPRNGPSYHTAPSPALSPLRATPAPLSSTAMDVLAASSPAGLASRLPQT